VDPERLAHASARLPTFEEANRLACVLTLMADPTRARLLYALDAADELCVGDLALALGVSEDAASYGLRALRTAGLVTPRNQGSDGLLPPRRRLPLTTAEQCCVS
jgi:DNA-binding transcriptional ArsR family regulator